MENLQGPRPRTRISRGVLPLALSGLMAVTLAGHGVANADGPDELPPTGLTFENYPAMKDVYEDYFSFGIFGRGELEGLLYNYASYTPGNEMKPESTQAEKGVFTYGAAEDAMALYSGRNPDIQFYGHTLAWHSQTPTWMWDAAPARFGQPGELDAEVALENLNTHIDGVLGHFGADLVGIDVVNEAIGTADPADWRASLAKGEGWYSALGWEWVELAFLRAAEVVDANGWDVKLAYNDFGLDSAAKAQVVHAMVADINERYEGVRPNGRPLIEVIGMQGHYNLATEAADVEASIELFATLPGVEVNITEMDIALPPGELTEANENNQGMKYAELFEVFRRYAAGPANTSGDPGVVTAVKLAGVRDVETGWKGGEFAMPYDYDGLAKDALIGILYPEEFLASHEYMEDGSDVEREPIDGVHVFDTSNGDSWSGANVILGDDASQWPWSTAGDDGVAFTPEAGATYRVSLNYTAKGTTAIRVRWIRDDSNGGYTDADGVAVNDHQYSATDVATHIPAYFNAGMVNMGTYTLVTEIELDADQPAEGLIGNIAFRGGAGGNAFSINTITVEKLGDGGEELLVEWPGAPVTEEPEESESPSPTPSPSPSDTAGPSPTPSATAEPSPTVTVTETVTAPSEPDGDLYETPGFHEVDGRRWMTVCEPYSSTADRCWTHIWATTIHQGGAGFVQVNGWAFNNLTYVAHGRAPWAGNPLGNAGRWTDDAGRQWRTECDTERTGRGGCRTWVSASVLERVGDSYGTTTKEVFNNQVRYR